MSLMVISKPNGRCSFFGHTIFSVQNINEYIDEFFKIYFYKIYILNFIYKFMILRFRP